VPSTSFLAPAPPCTAVPEQNPDSSYSESTIADGGHT